MTEFDKEQFTKWAVEFLEEISNLDIVLSNPKADSIFPCGVLGTPLDRVVSTNEGLPVEIALSVPFEIWANTKYECMRLEKQAIIKLSSTKYISLSPIFFFSIDKDNSYPSLNIT